MIWALIVVGGCNTAALSSVFKVDLTWQILVIQTICSEQVKKLTFGSGSAIIDYAEGIIFTPKALAPPEWERQSSSPITMSGITWL